MALETNEKGPLDDGRQSSNTTGKPASPDVERGNEGHATYTNRDGEETVDDENMNNIVPVESYGLRMTQSAANRDSPKGWIAVAAVFAQNTTSWGMNTSYGVFISYFISNDYFDASYLQYAFVGGLSVATAYLMAPLANYLTKSFGIRTPMAIGTLLVCLGQMLAGVSRLFGAYVFLQGVVFGSGLGLIQVPTQPLLPYLFERQLSLAQGIATCGSGFGGLIFALSTRAGLAHLGVKYTLVMNGAISAVVLVPCIFILNYDMKSSIKLSPLQIRWIWHRNFSWILAWGVLGVMGYLIGLYSVPAFATDGLGLSQSQGAALQSILAAGQVVGRPLVGFLLDKGGRINMSILANFMACISCLAIWLPARSFGVLVLYSLFQGAFGGITVSAISAVATSAVGRADVGSALVMYWVTIAIPAIFGQPIAVALINYSRESVGRSGPTVYQPSIIFCGSMFAASGMMLLGCKLSLQGKAMFWTKI